MASVLSPELQKKIKEATTKLAKAEKDLATALNELKVAERANKKMIGTVLQDAFELLASAKRNLEELLGEPPV